MTTRSQTAPARLAAAEAARTAHLENTAIQPDVNGGFVEMETEVAMAMVVHSMGQEVIVRAPGRCYGAL